jgi:hypothetical protein
VFSASSAIDFYLGYCGAIVTNAPKQPRKKAIAEEAENTEDAEKR